MDPLDKVAHDLAAELQRTGTRCVFAESCTAGLIAATLARVPGISAHLCGSAVVYRELTKREWLGLDAKQLEQHTAVSAFASREIARGVLEKTPEANVSLGVTGHLGPQAPPELDGIVFVSIWSSNESGLTELNESRIKLESAERADRQREAVVRALESLRTCLQV